MGRFAPPWWRSIYTNYLEFSLGDLSLLPHFFISIWTCGYFYRLWMLIQYDFMLLVKQHWATLCCSTSSSFGHWELFQLAPGSFWYTPIIIAGGAGRMFVFCFFFFFFWAFPYFLAWQGAPGSSCIFPAPDLESAISPRRPGLLYWNMVLETNVWGFPGGAVVENLPANAGDMGSSPGLGRSHMLRSS